MKTSLIARRIENDKSYFFKKENIEPVVHTQVVIWIDVPTRVRKFCVAATKRQPLIGWNNNYRLEKEKKCCSCVATTARRAQRWPSPLAASATNRDSYISPSVSGSGIPLRVGSHLCGVYCERDKRDLSIFAEGAWK